MFRVEEFSVFWLILEAVLDEERLKLGHEALDWRIRRLIDEECLADQGYHGINLDQVIGPDSQRFIELLALAARHVRRAPHDQGSFWDSLRRPQEAYEAGNWTYGDPVSRDALIGLILRFSLPWFSPPFDHPLMAESAWIRPA